jgi:hypothetical protein
MVDCRHQWEMVDVEFGFVAFEKCFHCGGLRTFFATELAPVLGEEYREGRCFWSRVENAQSFRFSLRCMRCGERHTFEELMGLLFCSGCDPACEIDRLQLQAEAEGEWALVAFGFTDRGGPIPIPPAKLEILADYFNQRRAPSRPRLRLLSFEVIAELSRCHGDFLHDVGMLSVKPPPPRLSAQRVGAEARRARRLATSHGRSGHDNP